MNKHQNLRDITYPSENGLHGLLKREAEWAPNKTALVFRDKSMTFRELDQASDQLAAQLLQCGIQPEDFVALYLERSLELITGIFGILKAGGAYVPVDVDYPKERMAFMVEDAQAKVILTQKHLKNNLPETGARIICLDEQVVHPNSPIPQFPNSPIPDQLAYMIYTSGSTGKPKGVMISHENVCNQLEGQHAIAPTPIEAMMLTCSISFDVSVLTIFWTICQGATLVIPQQGEEKDMAKLAETIYRNKVTHILTLPSLYTLLLEQALPEKLQTLKLVNVSGEVCPVSLAQKHEEVIPNGQLYNLYGPTEATVNCTYFTFPKGYNEAKAPIGIPIKNYEIFILDKNLQEVPRGEVGEIYIGGTKPVVGRGYWNRPELSAERFIDAPIKGHISPWYKTGDLARWMPDGNIEFLGRSDFQVKYRGFRIELGEVETAISNHDAVKETVVLLKNEHEVNNQKLVAYLTVNQGFAVTVSELRAFLSETLPEYMLPSHFVFLEKMPLTTNGKFDRKALPEPAGERPALSEPYEAPINDLEKEITALWERLLSVAPIGRNDKFFELGGTSIQAAQFIGAMMKKLDTSIFITTIFDYPTVATYAEFILSDYPKTPYEITNHVLLDSHGEGKNENPSPVLKPEKIEAFPKYIPIHLTPTLKSTNGNNRQPTTGNRQPIFILAPPRSGTTLLRVMLAGHPDLFACNELQLLHFETLKDRSEAYTGKFALWSEGLVRTVMELKNVDANEAKLLLQTFENKGMTTAEMFGQLQEWVGERIIVDKSPSYLLDPLALEKAIHDFPNAKFIHLVRHPFSMVKSFEKYNMDQVLYLKKHGFAARELGELVWLQSHQNALDFLQKIPAGQQHRLIYEDLIRQPEMEMKALCGALDIPFHPNLLDPYQDLEAKMTDGLYADSRSMGDTNFDKKKMIDPNKADEWLGVLKDNFLCRQTWEVLEKLGYEYVRSVSPYNVDRFFQNDKECSENVQPATCNLQRATDVAIIGMACRFPGANNVDEFWQNLLEAKDVSHRVTEQDLEEEGDPRFSKFQKLGKSDYVPKTYALDHPYSFDAPFFGYHQREAELTDPQHRLFLETAYHALEAAGYDPFKYEGKIGVFGGVAKNTYFTNNILTNPELLEAAGGYQEMIASESTFSISRVAYKLNLRGPAVNVQTACSTGGVAVHLACQSILSGDSDMVIVGGGRVQSPVNGGYEYVEGGPLSPDGTLRAFDENANGMVQGNGMGMLVLKRLDQAQKDGDHVWAVIKSSAINNDGSDKTGLTAPSSRGQADCIADAIKKAGLTGADISYFETHGTGTFIGDPIEIQGLAAAVASNPSSMTPPNWGSGIQIPIGSVKTNIGHLDAGACIAGIIKTALSLHHEMLPPTMHFTKPNPQLGLEKTPFYVVDKLQPWFVDRQPRRAGVSSFGLGGTNAHIILEEAPCSVGQSRNSAVRQSGQGQLLVVSAKTEAALEQSSSQLLDFIKNNPSLNLAHAAQTLAIGRPHFPKRKAYILGGEKPIEIKAGINHQSSTKNHFTFLFPGGGAQYEGMAKDLYASNAFFKKQVDACCAILKEEHGLDIAAVMWPNSPIPQFPNSSITDPSYALASLFTIEYSLAKLWQHWDIQPSDMIGHSMGEYTAACLAGVMTLENALSLVTVRGKLFESLKGDGCMISIATTEERLRPLLSDEHTISVINKKDSLVVSSTRAGIERLKAKLDSANIENRLIHIAVPAHSPLIEPILGEFRKHLLKIDFQPPTIPFISNVTGKWITNEEATSPDYWIRHIRQTVRFADGLNTLIPQFPNSPIPKRRIFLEVGPGQTLSTFVRAVPTLNGEQREVLASVRHPKERMDDVAFIYKSVGKMWVNGVDIVWENFFENENFQRVPLPTYPFERKKYFVRPNTITPQPPSRGDSADPFGNTIRSRQPEYSNLNIPTQSATGMSPLEGGWEVNAPETTQTSQTLNPTMKNESRIPTLIGEIKNSLHELSGMEPSEMDPQATFLELGFDSLFLSQAVIKINYKFKTKLSFRALFEETPTIEALAQYVDGEIAEDLFRPKVEMTVAPAAQPQAIGLPNLEGLVNPQNVNPQNQQVTMPLANGNAVQCLIQQQLNLMQQQLNLLQGSAPVFPSLKDLESLNGKNEFKTNGSGEVAGQDFPSFGNLERQNLERREEKEIEIKRSQKGVTAKMGNYKKIGGGNELTEQQKQSLAKFVERYNAMTQRSKEMSQRHRQYYADPRSVTGFSQLWKEICYQIAHEKSKGSKIWDVDGNEYIDYVMSYGVAIFGHMPDFVEEAVTAAIRRGNSIDLLPAEATEMARIIAELSGYDRVTLANTGTEAVLGAVRAARTATGKERIAVFDTDYHGNVDQFLVRGVNFKGKNKTLPSSPGIASYAVEKNLTLDYDDPDVLQKLEAEIGDLAAVVIEPVQAQNPHWQHQELIQQIRQLTEKHGVALIFDEIINGFRLDERGAQAWYGVDADISAYGKSISGGFPVAAIAGKKKYMDAFDGGVWNYGDDTSPDGVITYFASTFIKNPISVAAGHAAMKEIERLGPSLQADLNEKTIRFAERIREIFLKTKAPFMIQSASSFFMLKYVDGRPLNRLFNYYLRMHGVNVRERPCFLSTAHTEADFEKTYKGFEAAIADMFADGMIEEYHGEDLNVIVRGQISRGRGQVATKPITIPLTEGQLEIFLSDQFSADASRAYNIATEIRLEGEALDVERMKAALQALVDRHEALRTVINADGKTQMVLPKLEVEIPVVDLRNSALGNSDCQSEQSQGFTGHRNSDSLSEQSQGFSDKLSELRPSEQPNFSDWQSELRQSEQPSGCPDKLSELHREEAEHHFDLQNGPLIRFKIVLLEEKTSLVFIHVHHIICDGWSLGILTRELGGMYGSGSSLLNFKSLVNLKNTKPLSQYALEQADLQTSELYQENEKYWLGQFADSVPVLNLPTDFHRPPIKTHPGAVEKISLDEVTVQMLRKLAAKQGTTFYVFMLAAYQAFLGRITGQEDFVIGVAAAGHNLQGNQNLVAHAIGLLPVRTKIGEGISFKDYLKTVRGNVLDAFDHQQFTYGSLVKKLKMERSADHRTLVSVAFNLDSPLDDLFFGNMRASTRAIPRHYETFDSFINLKPLGKTVDFEWNFNTDLFRRETIQLRLNEFRQFLQSILVDVEKPITELRLLPDFETNQIASFNRGAKIGFPLHQCLHELFAEQAKKTPEKVAAKMTSGEQLTYQELDKKSDALAAVLMEKGVQAGGFVGLCLERSVEMLVGIYGILKTGAAYVPIDPRNPQERIGFMLKDAGCQAVVTQKGMEGELAFFKGEIVFATSTERKEETPIPQFPNSRISNSPAYVIYTSGSTGMPKGVVVRHENAVNTLFAINEHLHISEKSKVYSVSSMSFDMSIPDYFLTLIKGGTLILADEETKKDGFALRTSIEHFQPTLMQATPTTWQILMLSGWQGSQELVAVAGGEGFPKELAAKMMACCKAVWNGYGPTETTIYATYQQVTEEHLGKCTGEFVAIGLPIANTEMHILDKNGQPVPIGVPGELYIGGKGVSSGYLNREKLTNERFIHSPLTIDHSPLYKTGDLVRYMPTGEIEFLGRIDDQVKIRGFRIELGEIEEAIKQYPSVQQGAVNVFKDNTGSGQLAGYIVWQQKSDNEGLRAYLREKLPGFMVPAIFIEMEELPMNTSLKVDRKALPKPDLSKLSTAEKEAPSTRGEHLLTGIWKELLGVEEVSVQDDFFELGGHSLAAVQLMSRIREATGKRLPLTTLFQHSTIKKLASQLNGYNKSLNGHSLNGHHEPEFSSLICIQKGGDKTPLYLVHGGGLHVLFYQNMVKYLDKDQPIYALQAKGLNEGDEPLDSIEEMAAHYISEIKKQNPDGPYCLAGYSLGGLIAWEMASQLQAEQKEVPLLALFDAVAKYEWAGNGGNSNLKKKFKKLGFNMSLLLKDPAKTLEYKSNVLKMQFLHMKGKLAMAYRNNRTNEIEEGYIPYGKAVYEKSMYAYEKYVLQPLQIHVDLFKAKEQMFYLHDPDHYGWDQFALHGITTHEIEGNHLTLFDEPHGKEVAEALGRRMREVGEFEENERMRE